MDQPTVRRRFLRPFRAHRKELAMVSESVLEDDETLWT